jgi:hypothetical protein
MVDNFLKDSLGISFSFDNGTHCEPLIRAQNVALDKIVGREGISSERRVVGVCQQQFKSFSLCYY